MSSGAFSDFLDTQRAERATRRPTGPMGVVRLFVVFGAALTAAMMLLVVVLYVAITLDLRAERQRVAACHEDAVLHHKPGGGIAAALQRCLDAAEARRGSLWFPWLHDR